MVYNMSIDVIVRRLKWKEEVIHSPRGLIRDECYLGRGVDVLNVYERCGHACSYCYVEWPWSPRTVIVRSNIIGRVRRDLLRRYLGIKHGNSLSAKQTKFMFTFQRPMFLKFSNLIY